jgi:hypothetical protein
VPWILRTLTGTSCRQKDVKTSANHTKGISGIVYHVVRNQFGRLNNSPPHAPGIAATAALG